MFFFSLHEFSLWLIHMIYVPFFLTIGAMLMPRWSVKAASILFCVSIIQLFRHGLATPPAQ
jgi:hypothetical protein